MLRAASAFPEYQLVLAGAPVFLLTIIMNI